MICCLLSAFYMASGVPIPDSGYSAPSSYSDEPARYSYNYAVADSESGTNFGAQENRDAQSTSGSYFVALPDGRIQKVTYTVNGDAGYVAEVTYEGEARYPDTKSYSAPPQSSYSG